MFDHSDMDASHPGKMQYILLKCIRCKCLNTFLYVLHLPLVPHLVPVIILEMHHKCFSADRHMLAGQKWAKHRSILCLPEFQLLITVK